MVSYQKLAAERLGDFVKHLGKNVGEKVTHKTDLEIGAKSGAAAASNNTKLVAATAPDVIISSREGFIFEW